MHLVRGRANTVALGVALGLLLWIVLMMLAITDGVLHRMSSLLVVGVHIRLLAAIPLFFFCESVLDPRVTSFVRSLVRSGVVSQDALQTLTISVARITRWKDSWVPETICALLAVLLWWYGTPLSRFGTTAENVVGHPAIGFLTGQWYWTVCMTVFRFLMLRWLWRLCLWWYFLWTLSALPLRLLPAHPDGAAGIGYLDVVHAHFAPLVVAISLIQTASFAEGITAGMMPVEAVYPAVAATLFVDALLFLAPLLILTPKLWARRVKGRDDFMNLAERYLGRLERKWVGASDAPYDQLLGTPDWAPLVALKNIFGDVCRVRWTPASPRLITQLTIAALLPMAPLLLIKYPFAELMQKFVERLAGL